MATGYQSAEERKVPANNTETKQRERERTGGIPGEPGTEQVVATATPALQDPVHPLGSGSECYHLNLANRRDRVDFRQPWGKRLSAGFLLGAGTDGH